MSGTCDAGEVMVKVSVCRPGLSDVSVVMMCEDSAVTLDAGLTAVLWTEVPPGDCYNCEATYVSTEGGAWRFEYVL